MQANHSRTLTKWPAIPLSLAVVALLLSCGDSQPVPQAFIGSWQSDEELTLASVRQSDSVTPADLEMFEEDFFGDRVMIFRESEGATFFVNSGMKRVFEPARVVKSGKNFMTLTILATEYEPEHEQSWYVDGELIYADVVKWGFREYYRRVER